MPTTGDLRRGFGWLANTGTIEDASVQRRDDGMVEVRLTLLTTRKAADEAIRRIAADHDLTPCLVCDQFRCCCAPPGAPVRRMDHRSHWSLEEIQAFDHEQRLRRLWWLWQTRRKLARWSRLSGRRWLLWPEDARPEDLPDA